MDRIRWGIIGCGDVTERKSGPAFNKVPHSELVAVMRRDVEKVQDYAKRHQVPVWYTDARRLINDERINAIYIATPPASHEEYTIMALQARKPVYEVKPMALTASAAQRMVYTSAETGTKLSVAHYRREQPFFKKVKALLDTGVIGDVRLVDLKLFQTPTLDVIVKTDVNWRVDPAVSGGGLFHDLAPHQLDLMLYFFGKPVIASGTGINHAALYPADDLVTGYLRFATGVIFNGTWCFTVAPGNEKDSCEIFGSKGSIMFSIFKNQEITLTTGDKVEVFRFDPLDHVQQPMIEAVVRYFLGIGPNPCPPAAGLETMNLIEALTQK